MRLFALDKQRTKLNDDKVDANEHREQQHLARHRKREILSSRMPMFEDDAMGSDEPNGCRIMADAEGEIIRLFKRVFFIGARKSSTSKDTFEIWIMRRRKKTSRFQRVHGRQRLDHLHRCRCKCRFLFDSGCGSWSVTEESDRR